MSFNVIIMENKSEPIKVTKDLVTINTYSGTLKEETSLMDPVIKIECDIARASRCNYLSIPTFNRYYFVRDVRSIRHNLFEFSCHCDVLTSFADSIKACKAIVSRQENNWNLYLNDGVFKVYQNPIILTKEFPNGFTTPEFVLAVAGSAQSSNS